MASSASAETLVCAHSPLRILGQDLGLSQQVCSIGQVAVDYLTSCGANFQQPIEITVKDAFDKDHATCLGIYHCGEDRIDILSIEGLAALRDRDSAFQQIDDATYWESVIAHELAHAAYDRVPCPFSSCRATTEYFAYVTQISLLPDNQKSLFGVSLTPGFEPTQDSINPLILALSADLFATFSWLHFQRFEDPCAHMRAILKGRVYFDYEPL